MRRNCNLELRLVPPSAPLRPADYNHHHRLHHFQPTLDLLGGSPNERQQEQPLTIFYNGMVNVSDVTELQARAIMMVASREMEEKLKSLLGPEPSSPLQQSPLCSPSEGLDLYPHQLLQNKPFGRTRGVSFPWAVQCPLL
ncbi:unnamed protein product [Camellia sinensis]